MNRMSPGRFAARFGMLFLLVFGLVGCATNKIDWNARVGGYTFDQAILDMGPPAKQAKLKDGTVVAEWMIRRGYTEAYYSPAYYYPYHYRRFGPVIGTPIITTSPDVFLRLTFNPQGTLTAWKKVAL